MSHILIETNRSNNMKKKQKTKTKPYYCSLLGLPLIPTKYARQGKLGVTCGANVTVALKKRSTQMASVISL